MGKEYKQKRVLSIDGDKVIAIHENCKFWKQEDEHLTTIDKLPNGEYLLYKCVGTLWRSK